MSDPLNVDPAALQRLQRLGGNAFVCKMIDLFLDYAGKKIADTRAAQAAGDVAALARAVHPIKSSAGNVGAARIQALALQVEDLALQGSVELLPAVVADLQQAFADVKPELEKQRQAFSGPASAGVS